MGRDRARAESHHSLAAAEEACTRDTDSQRHKDNGAAPTESEGLAGNKSCLS